MFMRILCAIMTITLWGLDTALSSGSPATAPAATNSAPSMPQTDTAEEKIPPPLQGEVENASVTEGQVSVDGQMIAYRATAANMPMKDEDGKLKATVFFTAYERLGAVPEGSEKPERLAADPHHRPITFVFNGGPGAASVWLHLGTAGPRRIELKKNGEAPGPPYRLIENTHTWLDVTDLVFIDPVGTGYSRPAEGQKGSEFYGVQEDIRWVADFIRLYITKYERWASPMFLAGESYGTTRAAGLSEYLLDRYGIALNGIVFISTVLDFQTLRPGAANDLPYPLYLPTYAATAWHHGKLAPELQADLQKTLTQAEQWAINTYLVALTKGDALAPDRRRQVVRMLARFTALPASVIEKCNLRIPPHVFQKYLLAGETQIVGRFDSRIVGFDPEPMRPWPSYDPSLSQYLPVYSATFNDYARRTLKYDSLLPYEVLSDKVRPWNFGEDGQGYLSVADNLRSAMVKNPSLKALFASGYFDLATPYFATDFTINRLNLSDDLRANIRHTYYQGGHMMYHVASELAAFKADLADFIREALPKP
ncbi:MAG: peptidase S10 [Phycisphaerales bacterium]|nr:peptidase S10 [Phycisphaerales bacterium]